MFMPLIMAVEASESGFREKCEKTPASIVFVKPGTREENL
jgi:hypothetical protein